MILAEFEHEISEVAIVPSGGGVFEVMLDEDLVYSKKATGQHADFDGVLADLRGRIQTKT